jgi:hypothetical protein
VSLFALVLAVVALALWRWRPALFSSRTREQKPPGERESSAYPALLAGVFLLVVVARLAVIGPFTSLWRPVSDPAHPFPAQHQVDVKFAGGPTLVGWSLSSAGVGLGGTTHLILYWRAEQPLNRDLAVFTHLYDADGNLQAQQDNFNPAATSVRTWPADKYASDEHVFVLPDRVEKGEYTIRVGLYDQHTMARVPTTVNGKQVDYLPLTTLTVR